MAKRGYIPIWFQKWLSNEYAHLAMDVKINKRVATIQTALIIAILVRLFIG